MILTLKWFTRVVLLACLVPCSLASDVQAAAASVEISAGFVNRNSVLGISRLRALHLESADSHEGGVFGLPQTLNYHLSYTQKLHRCETTDCSDRKHTPTRTSDGVSIQAVTSKTRLAFKAKGEPGLDPNTVTFLSPLIVIVSYE